MTIRYQYEAGDPFRERFDYAYSRYEGPGYLSGWRRSRERVRADLRRQPSAQSTPRSPSAAQVWFERIRTGLVDDDQTAIALVDKVLRRFEVSKRVFEGYDERGRPLDATEFREVGWYVAFAGLLAEAYRRSEALTYLNGLLKCLDIVCVYHQSLSESDAGRLGELIEDERSFVWALAGQGRQEAW